MTTMPMIATDGSIGDVPQENVSAAVKAGYKVGQDMLSPDGKTGTIPLEKVHDAIKAGFQIKGANPQKPAAPTKEMDEDLPQTGFIGAGMPIPAQDLSEQHHPGLTGGVMKGMLGAAAGVSGIGAAEALPAVLPHTIQGVKAIGTWATKNPVQAYILYNVIKEMIPGAKKTMGIIKDAPE